MTQANQHHSLPTPPVRNLKLDWLRGYFMVIITINHLRLAGNEWLRPFTGGDQLWVSAAAGFVLIAGIVLVIVYDHTLAQRGFPKGTQKALRRAAQLYLITVIGHLILASGDYLLHLWYGRPTSVPLNYFHLLQGAVFQTRYPYPSLDLLPLYVVLLPIGLLAVSALQHGKWRTVAFLSIFAWAIRQSDMQALRIFPYGFQSGSWQLLFVAGVFVGFYRDRLQQWWQAHPVVQPWLATGLLTLTGTLLFINYQVAFHDWFETIPMLEKNSILFNKPDLGLGRALMGMLTFAAFYTAVTLAWRPFNTLLGWLFIPLGQNSLTAYVGQALISYVVMRLPGWPFGNLSPAAQAGVSITAVLLLWLLIRAAAALYPTLKIRKRRLTMPSSRSA